MKPPPPPKTLSEPARKAWRMFCAQIGDVKPSDHAPLMALCQAWVALQDAQAHIDSEGEIITLVNNWPGPNPWSRVRRDARIAVVQLCRQFRLTPATRVTNETDDGDKDKLPEI